MALKFLNKKGWHTGSLRNIENVWKAEQKHEAEQKKLEELRLQIQQERERSEFRALQEQAGLVPRQERLEFLYESGLAVGKGGANSSGTGVAFQALEQPAKADINNNSNNNDNKQQSSVPGALFEDKPHSANDAWRKLHSDPLLLIRQREQEALAHVRNNPVQMALIHKSVQEKKHKEKDGDKDGKKKDRHSSSKHHKHSSSKYHSDSGEDIAEVDHKRKSNRHRTSRSYGKHYDKTRSDSEDESRKRESHRDIRHKEMYQELSPSRRSERENTKNYGRDDRKRIIEESDHERHRPKSQISSVHDNKERENGNSFGVSGSREHESQQHRRRGVASKLSEEERAARLRQMQMDAELHEEQRWKRLKKAEEADAQEAKQNSASGGRNFLDVANKSVYGAEKGGSSTIEESVRRRTHYSQRGSEAEGNAFRR